MLNGIMFSLNLISKLFRPHKLTSAQRTLSTTRTLPSKCDKTENVKQSSESSGGIKKQKSCNKDTSRSGDPKNLPDYCSKIAASESSQEEKDKQKPRDDISDGKISAKNRGDSLCCKAIIETKKPCKDDLEKSSKAGKEPGTPRKAGPGTQGNEMPGIEIKTEPETSKTPYWIGGILLILAGYFIWRAGRNGKEDGKREDENND